MDEIPFEELTTYDYPEEIQAWDNMLFDEILDKLKGETERIMYVLMDKCQEGCARQVYRSLEEECRYEASLLATDPGAEIVKRDLGACLSSRTTSSR